MTENTFDQAARTPTPRGFPSQVLFIFSHQERKAGRAAETRHDTTRWRCPEAPCHHHAQGVSVNPFGYPPLSEHQLKVSQREGDTRKDEPKLPGHDGGWGTWATPSCPCPCPPCRFRGAACLPLLVGKDEQDLGRKTLGGRCPRGLIEGVFPSNSELCRKAPTGPSLNFKWSRNRVSDA